MRYTGYGSNVVFAVFIVIVAGGGALAVYHNPAFALMIGGVAAAVAVYYIGRALNSTVVDGRREYHNRHTLSGIAFQNYSWLYGLGALVAYIAWAVSLFRQGIWWAGLVVVLPVAAPVAWFLVTWIRILVRRA